MNFSTRRIHALVGMLRSLERTGAPFATQYSAGADAKAHAMAERCRRAFHHLETLFAIRPEITLFVLSQEDWGAHAFGSPFGMPHWSRGELVVASEPSEFWRSVADIVVSAKLARHDELETVYGFRDGQLDLTRWFDLVVVHELGHAFQFAGQVSLPRLWLTELFANYCMYSYIAAAEPAELRTLDLATDLFLSSDHPFSHRSLADLEALYSGVGGDNYVWYQCKLIVGARNLQRRVGDAALVRLWQSFRVTDRALADRLRNGVDHELAALMEDWSTGR